MRKQGLRDTERNSKGIKVILLLLRNTLSKRINVLDHSKIILKKLFEGEPALKSNF